MATIYGSGVFSDPNGEEWLLVATAGGVYQMKQGMNPTRVIPLRGNETITAEVELVQAFTNVIMFRGAQGSAPLVWDGTSPYDEGKFDFIVDSDDVTYTERIPNASHGVVMAGRLFCPSTRDTVAVSDILNYTAWDSTLNAFRLNSGEDDSIVALHPYRRSSLVVFKDQSIHRLTNVEGDLSTTAADVINGEVGCAARKSVATVGGDIFYLSHLGVMRFSESVEDSMVAQEVAVSESIQPYFDRLNWDKVDTCCGKAQGRYYYLAVPLDGSTYPNVLLSYDTTTQQWQGYDTFPASTTALHRLHNITYLGRTRLVSVDHTFERVRVHDHHLDLDDPGNGTEYPINASVTTRGYVGGTNDRKHWRHANIEIEAYNPSATVSVLTDGVNEERTLLSSWTRDPAAYTTHGSGAHDVADPATHDNPHREDYRVLTDDLRTIADASPFNAEEQQIYQAGFPLRETGRWCALKVVNAQGALTLKTAAVDGVRIPNHGRITTS